MRKEELQKELKDVDTIYVVGTHISTNANWDKGIWDRFSLYYIKDNKLKKIFIEGDDIPAYWEPLRKNKKGYWIGGYFKCKALGTDRVFEIVYSLGRWLFNDGYKFNYVFLSE